MFVVDENGAGEESSYTERAICILFHALAFGKSMNISRLPAAMVFEKILRILDVMYVSRRICVNIYLLAAHRNDVASSTQAFTTV